MKIYQAINLQPVNAVKRQPASIIIPPFEFLGRLKVSVSNKWYPNTNCKITSAFVTATGPGSTSAELVILKNNIFEQNIVIATTDLGMDDIKSLFTFTNPLAGVTFGPYDWITVASFSASGHSGIVVQMQAESIN